MPKVYDWEIKQKNDSKYKSHFLFIHLSMMSL